jgi:hypothetical protein
MINAAPYIRKAFFALLNNAVVYEGVTVPVYDGSTGDLVQGPSGLYKIELGEQTGQEANNKHAFNGEWTQNIEVITELKGSPLRKHCDAIAGLIMALVHPATPTTHGLAINPSLQIWRVKLRTISHVDEEGDTSYVNRTILTYSFNITQK